MYAREKLLCENDIYTHISKWNLPLSEELKSFYIHYEFEYLYVNNISLSRIDQVASRQAGFRTISNDFGKTHLENPDWNKYWLVFADLNDDPIVLDTRSGEILSAIEGVEYLKILQIWLLFLRF